MKNTLSQEAALRLRTTLTPSQIQEIRILEYPTLELEERIAKELEENPGLERDEDEPEDNLAPDESTKSNEDNENSDSADAEPENNDLDLQAQEREDDPLQNDEFDFNDYISDDDDTPDYRLQTSNSSPDDKQEEIPFSVGESFHESLLSQLGFLKLSEQDYKVAQYIIGNIDDEGYLRRPVESLADDLAFVNIEVSDEHLRSLIQLIQNNFDPAGVGASNLQECLLLQLRRKPQTPLVVLATTVLEKRYPEYIQHHYQKIMDRLNIDADTLQAVIHEIRKLTPKPGASMSTDVYQSGNVVIPDFFVDNEDGRLRISLNNGNIPELRVNAGFNRMMKEFQSRPTHTRQDKDAMTFIKDRIDSAQWFINAIRQRNNTLRKTMTAIVGKQEAFFLSGDESDLKPLILKDIADLTGFDISTISRVSNSKYVQTPYGVFPLKFFFSESMTNDQGEEIATRAIKNALQELIDGEDKANPLNDDELVVVLKQKGFVIARRTIAKYRKQLNIPVARLRKKL